MPWTSPSPRRGPPERTRAGNSARPIGSEPRGPAQDDVNALPGDETVNPETDMHTLDPTVFDPGAEAAMIRETVARIGADFGHEYFMEKTRAEEYPTELWDAMG